MIHYRTLLPLHLLLPLARILVLRPRHVFGWCVVLLMRHSRIVRLPGRTCMNALPSSSLSMGQKTVRLREIGTSISEASKRVPVVLHDVRGGKQVSVK